VDKILLTIVNNKISEISLNFFCVSFNDSDQQQTRIAKEWLQANCRNSSETISGLQIRLDHGLSCLGAMLEAYHKLHPKPKSITKLKKWPAGDLGQGQPATGTVQQDLKASHSHTMTEEMHKS